MKHNLLIKTAISSVIFSVLTGCGGTDEGYDPQFKSDSALVIDTAVITSTLEEESAVQEIDLLQGVTIDGKPASESGATINVSELEFVANNNFITPQTSANTIASHRISPFTQSSDSTKLVINTDAFSAALRQCDQTDIRGALDGDGNPIADGNLDFPSQVIYNITYSIDNGANRIPGEALPSRTLQLTINAIDDPVSEVTISPIEVPVGGQASVFASAIPSYACNPALVYSIADEDIATIDENGLISAKNTGETTITATSVDNPEVTANATLTVTGAFSIAITNDDKNELGASSGNKDVPICVASGIEVQPALLNAELSGEYTFDWTLNDEVSFTKSLTAKSGFGEVLAVKAPTTIDSSNTVTVKLIDGDTASTPLSLISQKSITVNTVNNQMCEPGVSEHPAGFNTDFNLDGEGAPYKGNATYSVSATSVSGNGRSLEITAGTATQGEANTPYSFATQQVWNKQRNWYSANYGRGAESVGKTYRFSAWVKLNQIPEQPITLRHVVVPWVYEGIPDDAQGFTGRYSQAGLFSAELDATTQWQYIEFTEDTTNTREWAIPTSWSSITDVFTLWEVHGMPTGDSILIDDYAVVRTDQ
ncbi:MULTISPECIES: Ig-like domain-containing protein [unclassified Pseudoalteromonas]|uniref:Ig-like domain-containing protein n=1 Tax=unclassified Pseudoalteromonas TaxID=194690 RepID=UPI0006DCDBF8|nr:Ig-like domain-containing protein [Pseudoalteromonas sp. P1-11]KPV98994.1 Bacterial Ig-like domain (group 2) [Pseudoalteromonas sp. P1-11]